MCRIVLLVFAVAALLAGGAAPAATTPLQANGRIVFSTVDGMASMNPDGSGQWGLRFTRSGQSAPAWSPDGSTIALSDFRDGPQDIYLMDPDGTNVRRLTNGANVTHPTWSPDGTHLAFDDGTNVFTIAADGTGATRLLAGTAPAWSPDGTRIAFDSLTRDGGLLDIFLMAPDGGHAARLTTGPGNDYDATWSPDGSRIAFLSDRDGQSAIFVMNADGSAQRSLGPATVDAHSKPAWSPDGSRIAFARDGEIWTVDADGSDPRRLTNAGVGAAAPAWQPLPPAPPGCTLWGTAANDLLVGTEGDDTICGLGGDDTLIGLGGNDSLYGGPGNDWIAGGLGQDLLEGGDDNDLLDARDGGPDAVFGGPGADRVLIDKGSHDTVQGGERIIVSRDVAAWRPTTASHEEPTNPAVFAVDGRIDDYWSSGNYPPQWLEVDLQRPTTIVRLRLIAPDVPARSPVLILARNADGSYRLLHRFIGPFVFKQAVSFTPKRPWRGVRWLRLQIGSGAGFGWVAWPEIEAYD